MSEKIKNSSGEDTMLSPSDLKHLIEFTNQQDMVKQQIRGVLEGREDWTRATEHVQQVETRAKRFFAQYQPGDELWWFEHGVGLAFRAGLVLLRNKIAVSAWIQMMS